MLTVDFSGSNATFGKPANMTDEECGSCKAMIAEYDDGVPYVLTAWLPSYEDIQAFQAGRPLMLQILGRGMPPVSLWTRDAEGEPNV